MIQLNFIDFIILAVIIYQGYKGYNNGLVMTFAPLVYWFIAFFLSVHFMGLGGKQFAAHLGVSERVGGVVSFIVLITLSLIAVKWVINTINGIIGKGKVVGASNRLVGALLGGLKGFLLLSMVFLLLRQVDIPKQNVRDTSFFYSSVHSFVYRTWDIARIILPQAEGLASKFKENFDKELRR